MQLNCSLQDNFQTNDDEKKIDLITGGQVHR